MEKIDFVIQRWIINHRIDCYGTSQHILIFMITCDWACNTRQICTNYTLSENDTFWSLVMINIFDDYMDVSVPLWQWLDAPRFFIFMPISTTITIVMRLWRCFFNWMQITEMFILQKCQGKIYVSILKCDWASKNWTYLHKLLV